MDKYINGLRIIETTRNFYEININNLIDNGYIVLVKKVEPLPALFNNIHIFQHKQTKHIAILGMDGRQWNRFKKSEHELLEKIIYYPYTFENPYAAYLIPPDIQINERVFVADLIEDYIGMKHWGNSRLKSCEAIWNGKNLEILYNEYQMPNVIG